MRTEYSAGQLASLKNGCAGFTPLELVARPRVQRPQELKRLSVEPVVDEVRAVDHPRAEQPRQLPLRPAQAHIGAQAVNARASAWPPKINGI